MSWVDCKPEVRLGTPAKIGKETFRDLDVSLTLLTCEMPVRRACEMVRRRAVPEVGVNDYAEALELLQVPVDGRDGDVRGMSLNLGRQLLGRPVPRRLEQGADEKTSRRRHPTAGRAHAGEHSLDVGIRWGRNES